MVTLRYVPGTTSGSFALSEFTSFQKMMAVDMSGFAFDPVYAENMRLVNGGQPENNYIATTAGSWFSIDRILNFANAVTGTDEDRLFNVQQVWNLIEDRLRPGMFPFAALSGGDFLIFDHAVFEKAQILIWYHERSEEDNPYTELISENFSTFVVQLRNNPV